MVSSEGQCLLDDRLSRRQGQGVDTKGRATCLQPGGYLAIGGLRSAAREHHFTAFDRRPLCGVQVAQPAGASKVVR
jgi:hypothetical protein